MSLVPNLTPFPANAMLLQRAGWYLWVTPSQPHDWAYPRWALVSYSCVQVLRSVEALRKKAACMLQLQKKKKKKTDVESTGDGRQDVVMAQYAE